MSGRVWRISDRIWRIRSMTDKTEWNRTKCAKMATQRGRATFLSRVQGHGSEALLQEAYLQGCKQDLGFLVALRYLHCYIIPWSGSLSPRAALAVIWNGKHGRAKLQSRPLIKVTEILKFTITLSTLNASWNSEDKQQPDTQTEFKAATRTIRAAKG